MTTGGPASRVFFAPASTKASKPWVSTHISEISENRIKAVRDELKEGDQVLVKVLALEGNKIKLSRKAVLREQREKIKK